MRVVNLESVSEAVYNLIKEVNSTVSPDVCCALEKSLDKEESELGKYVIKNLLQNVELGKKTSSPVCQDTGVVVCFLEIGSEVCFEGCVYEAIDNGVKKAYEDFYLRKSIVNCPLRRVNTKTNTPAITHVKIVRGTTFKITICLKGGGSENMSLVKMLSPADGVNGIKKLVLDTVSNASGKPCPPIVVGIGIGGNLEKSALIAKEALLGDIFEKNEDEVLANLENELLESINKLGIGPMGFGGSITCLGVKINTYPTHIASLPVAINIQCHASRHKSIFI